jgi:hypothetical protein
MLSFICVTLCPVVALLLLVFSEVHIAQSIVFCLSVMFCRSLFVLLSFFVDHCVVYPSSITVSDPFSQFVKTAQVFLLLKSSRHDTAEKLWKFRINTDNPNPTHNKQEMCASQNMPVYINYQMV